MKILHRYIVRQLGFSFLIALCVFTFLFLIFDFFDRIDNIVSENTTFGTVLQYFFLKVPATVTLLCPVAMLVGSLFTVGLLSKNSEFTAMRAAGCTIPWLCRPIFLFGIGVALLSILLNETVVPLSARRVREIYNIEIKKKDQRGSYSQSDIWWRSKGEFFSVGQFDSRTATLQNLSKFQISENLEIIERTDAKEVEYVDPILGWTMRDLTRYRFDSDRTPTIEKIKQLPLPMNKTPQDFYDVDTDPETLSFRGLRKFIRQQERNGIPIAQYMADLYAKLSFPFFNLIVALVVIPFALQPARSGNMAKSILAAFIIGFSYYIVHSFAVSMGRAEFLPAFLAAWTANIFMGVIGGVLLLGAESPQ
jgi:lipopolysaccharide export system permease protein